jgi:hypothetical protein
MPYGCDKIADVDGGCSSTAERYTVDVDVEGSKPFSHPPIYKKKTSKLGSFSIYRGMLFDHFFQNLVLGATWVQQEIVLHFENFFGCNPRLLGCNRFDLGIDSIILSATDIKSHITHSDGSNQLIDHFCWSVLHLLDQMTIDVQGDTDL